ncbi:hypothetical protein [Staphylococcus aureus]|uniref:hypothetical protein n=5 Tax=Staphylococcus aureus TaxID=1280 RepID=UPI001F5B50F1|nr:hypothetical protein [Staphylococcus aureus]
MSRSKKYFYLSSLMIILSFFFNTNNVFLSGFFNSFIKLILFCSVINSIVLILSIIFADRSIKSLKPDADWIRIASKSLPWIILIVILVHIFSIVRFLYFIYYICLNDKNCYKQFNIFSYLFCI